MTYQKLDTLPAYEQLKLDDKGKPLPSPTGAIRWGGKVPPPAIGTAIFVIVNGRFPAKVTGYFTEEGFLGLRCTFTEDIEVFGRKIKAGTEDHTFGPEFVLAEPEAPAGSPYTVIVRHPDYIDVSDDGCGGTYQAHVTATSPEEAFGAAQDEACRSTGREPGEDDVRAEDWAVVAVFAGHLNDLHTP